MARVSPFDVDFNELLENTPRVRPLFTLENLDDEEAVLEWVNNTYNTELQRAMPYRERAKRHADLYKNRWYPNGNGRSGSFADASTQGLGINSASSRPAKVTVNHLFDLVNQRVARVLSQPSDVDVSPANNEYRDRVAAKVTGMWLSYLFDKNNIDRIKAKVAKATFIMGEAYCWPRWNPNKGRIHPSWTAAEQKAQEEGRTPRLPLIDEKTGEQVTGQDGSPLWIERPVRVGEVEFVVCTPLNTLVQLTGDFERSDYFFYEEYQDLDELKALYPGKASEIEPDSQEGDDAATRWGRISGVLNGPQSGKVLVRYFRHRPTEFLGNGRWIVSTRGAILENRALQPREEGLHLCRLVDIDNPDDQQGQSFFVQGKAINASINDLTSMGMRNQKMLSHPKWIYPKGSLVKKDALGNDITEVAFSGPIAPHVYTPPPMNSENMAMRADLKNDLRSVVGSNGGFQSEIPANVRTATGLQAMYEQSEMRSSQQNLNMATFLREIAEVTINIASAYYEKDDVRLIPVVGRDNRYLLKEFDPANLSRGFDIRVKNDSGLPNSSTVRFDMLIRLKEAMPEYVTEERAAQFLDLGDSDRIFDAATAALRSAEAENEAILSGETIEGPKAYEAHLTHWTSHAKEMQNYSFKSDVPPEVQQRLFDHQLATEMLIMEACRKNPRFAVETAKIAQFPLLYNLSAEDYMVMDAARTGNPLTLQQVAILYSGGVKKLQMAMATGEVPLPGAAAASGSAGGFNAATNGVGGMSEAGGNSPKVNTLASPEKVDTMAAPRQPPNLQ
jgi:hypothetical protein